MVTMRGELSETHHYTDFVAAGQDAIALVFFFFMRPLCGECKLIAMNLQTLGFPTSKATIQLADAAAIKVRYSAYLVECL